MRTSHRVRTVRAELRDWQPSNNSSQFFGNIYDDKLGQYADGTPLSFTNIRRYYRGTTSIAEKDPHFVLETINEGAYILYDKYRYKFVGS